MLGYFPFNTGRGVTVVDGTTPTGIYGPNGTYNVVFNSGLPGIYHPCGAFNVVAVTTQDAVYSASGGYTILETVPGAVIRPTIVLATAAGTVVSVAFSEALKTTSLPSTSAFTVRVNGSPVTISSVGVTGSTLTLTLAATVGFGTTVTVSYVDPTTGDDTVALQSAVGDRDVATFSNRAVTNNTAAAPTIVSAAINADVMTLVFSEALKETNLPATSAFTAVVNGSTRTVSSVTISTNTVTLTLSTKAQYGNTATIAYTDPTGGDDTNALQRASDDVDVATFSAFTAINNTAAGPTLSSAAVNGNSLVLTFSEAMKTTSLPAGSAFTVLLDGVASTVSSLVGSGSTITLTLATPAAYLDVVTVAYTDPTSSDDTTALQSATGDRDVASFGATSVVNNTPDGIPVSSVFATSLYTGNGSTQTITNGIDNATNGGLVWFKARSQAYTHQLVDSVRGGNKALNSNTTSAESSLGASAVSAFNTNGYTISTGSGLNNDNGTTTVAWNFRRATKFFDIVTYTGNGASRTISHNLGSVPGMIIVKSLGSGGSWAVYHRSLGATQSLTLNTTNASGVTPTYWNDTAPTSTTFSLGTGGFVNFSGETYVAYLFAHDTDPTGLIQCGSLTTNGSGVATVTGLPWAPQFLLTKRSDNTGDWAILDTTRGWGSGADQVLIANTSAAEISSDYQAPTSDGFTYSNANNATYIYMAIRAP